MLRTALLTVLAAGLVVASPLAAAPLATELVADGLGRAVGAVPAPGQPDRLYVIDSRQGTTGRIWIVDLPTGNRLATPFLEVPNVTTANEQGLLGLAFHPDYAANGEFYVNYTTTGGGAAGRTLVERYQRSAGDPDVADPTSAATVLTFDQPASNHNAGWMDFGPDGHLYIATGDGGANSSQAQNLSSLLGNILRIDPVVGAGGYTVPTDNPFVGNAGALDEIWAYGLRNPWRDSFDRQTGDLWIADVGASSLEEVNKQLAASSGGENYAWPHKEGTQINNPPVPADAVDPVHVYSLPGSQAITGGYVYRGSLLGDEYQGRYFFGDYINGRVWSIDALTGDDLQDHTSALVPPGESSIGFISSFGQDANGELYIVTLDGSLYQVVPEPATLSLLGLGVLALRRRRR